MTSGASLEKPDSAWLGQGNKFRHRISMGSYLSNRFPEFYIFLYVQCSIYYAALQRISGLEEQKNGFRKDGFGNRNRAGDPIHS